MDGILIQDNLSIVIPARYSSSRLPGKVLEDIHGYPMIYWTYQRACMAGIGQVVIAADDEIVYRVLDKLKIPFIETSQAWRNGTERIAEVALKIPETTFFMNIQGDEPLLNPQTIIDVYRDGLELDCFKTAISKISNGLNSSEVKVALSTNNQIRYASRSPIPFARNGEQCYFKIHGIYTYSRDTLTKFIQCKPGPLELMESVEQLRCIENDIRLIGVEAAHTEISVDTFEDLVYMRKRPESDFREWVQRDN
jgi:3-deoxy-manno-octulosonate cytidylyltransferase (CMP-KDO synthetase)